MTITEDFERLNVFSEKTFINLKILKTNVKITRMGSIKWTYNKEQSFATEFWLLYFFENLISVQEPLKNSRFNVPTTEISIFNAPSHMVKYEKTTSLKRYFSAYVFLWNLRDF